MFASVNLPLHHKVQKFSSGTGSSGGPIKRAAKRSWCGGGVVTLLYARIGICLVMIFLLHNVIILTDKQACCTTAMYYLLMHGFIFSRYWALVILFWPYVLLIFVWF